MRTSLLAMVLILAGCSGILDGKEGARTPELQLDQATKEYLEGAWLIGKQPIQGSCTSRAYPNEQYEFEFRRSGGRLIIYEPFDLFAGVAIRNVERTSDILIVTLAVPDQSATTRMRL